MRRRLHYRSRSRYSSHNHNRKWPGREEAPRERVFEKPLPRTVRSCGAYWGLTSGTKSRVPLLECIVCEPALSELPFAAGFFAIEQFADENNHLQEWQYNHLSLFLCPLTLALSVPRPRSSAPLPRLYDLQFCVDRITQMEAQEVRLFTCSSGLAHPFFLPKKFRQPLKTHPNGQQDVNDSPKTSKPRHTFEIGA